MRSKRWSAPPSASAFTASSASANPAPGGRRDLSTPHDCYGRDGAGGAVGDIGAEFGALPVVLGGVAGRGDIGELIGAVALPVVALGALLAVLLLLFQPAIRMIA